MRSKIATGAAIALLTVLSIAAGLSAQEQAPGHLASGPVFKTLITFDNTDGAAPEAGLVQGTDGNFYGTTSGYSTYGTVFKITPQGQVTTLHVFDLTDGAYPETAMVLGTGGNFYGTTYFGGPNPDACPAGLGCGTVFKVTPTGTLTTLYNFCPQAGCFDGEAPGPLVQGSDGNFYGTTARGGSTACEDACGTVFKITPAGVLTQLYKFTPRSGYSPYTSEGLVQATDGNFYGTTMVGGSSTACSEGCGTVFQMTPEGALTTLHSFDFTHGAGPTGLIEAADGNLYGTTGGGGVVFYRCDIAGSGCGTVFKMTLQGTFTSLASFASTNGSDPLGLVQAIDGNFYGTGESGGSNRCNCGVIFEITPAGGLTPLHSFSNYPGTPYGFMPQSGLLQATNGTFYGTTPQSGSGYGVVYSLSVGLGPFVKSVPTAGKTGTAVTILGNNLKLATGVTFNGVPATSTVGSSTYIKATVPEGATNGPIQVTLLNGSLTSNVNFQVLP